MMRIVAGVVAFAFWLVLANFALTKADSGSTVLFWLASAAVAVGACFRFLRPQAKPPQTRDVPVSLCLPLPQRSASVSDAMRGLPEHCSELVAEGIIAREGL
jgi:hypothetical protein